MITLSAIILILLNFVDYITTVIGLAWGASESNFIVRKIIKTSPTIHFFVKNIVLTYLIVMLQHSFVLKPLIVFYTIVCINNIITIIQQYKIAKEFGK